MKIPDDLGEFPTWEDIVSDIKSHGCTYEEEVDAEGRTLRIIENPQTGVKCSIGAYRETDDMRWNILKEVYKVIGKSLDR